MTKRASKRSDIQNLFTFDRHEHVNMIYLTQNSFNPGTLSSEISGMGASLAGWHDYDNWAVVKGNQISNMSV